MSARPEHPSGHARVVPFRRPVPVASVQGTLALDLVARQDPPSPRRPRPLPAGTCADVIPIDQRLRQGVEAWARRYAQAAVEIVGGDRPVTQLLRWSSRDVYDDLARRALLVARAGGHRPGQGRVQPVRPVVRGVHSCFWDRDTVEVSVRVRYGPRSRAVAARFEQRQERWVCTALEFA
ncbi:MAG: Rv3235 family protein [Nocardioides sp.]